MNGLSSFNAAQGLQASLRQFDRAAAAVTSATTPATGADIVDRIVGMRQAATSIKANIAVTRAADEMLGTLLDIHA